MYPYYYMQAEIIFLVHFAEKLVGCFIDGCRASRLHGSFHTNMCRTYAKQQSKEATSKKVHFKKAT